MQDYLYIDIETLPDMSVDALENAKADIKAPSNYKDEEKIEKYINDKAAEAVNKTSFDGFAGHVCTIAWVINSGIIKSMHIEDVENEHELLSGFFSELPQFKSLTWVGHNLVEFDIPFLLKRAFCLGVKLPPINAFPRNPKPWDKKVFDTMNVFGRVSLDKATKAMGRTGKNGMSGKDVYPMWSMGNHDMIEAYCRDDVADTRAIHERLLSIGY